MIAGVILAAGGSVRLGRPKQLVRIGGRSLLRRTVDCVAGGGCRPVVVVLGAEAERIAPELQGLDVTAVLNRRWRDGLSSSILAGLSALEGLELPIDGVLLACCDQPRLTPGLIGELCARFEGPTGPMIAAAYAGTVGTPAVFPAERLADLRGLAGDRGARGILAAAADRVVAVPWPEGAIDIDLPEDLG